MSLLSIVQNHCTRSGLPVPASVQSSSDPQVSQLVGLLQEFCDDMITRRAWQANTFEATFTSTAAEDQGAIATIAPYGFEELLVETIFDRTQRLPLYGGINPSEWQSRKAFNFAGPLYSFRLRGGRLLFSPALPAAHIIAFEYFSSFFARTAAAVPQNYMVLDTDTCSLGDRLPSAYLRWAWKKEKGFDYAEDFAAYERLVMISSMRDGRPQKVSLDSKVRDMQPGVMVPYGSWNL